ncbi:MAG: hypothetical protein KKB38_20635 [Gammaproteobacteria bacterium]|nr:hypothetical protein [Gammaproteobacteria bacterium]
MNEWVQFQASGGPTTVNCVFIGKHNFTKTASILWQGNSTSDWASGPALSVALSVATDARGAVIPKIGYYPAAAQTHEFWRLYVQDSANASVNLEMGRVMAGRYYEPTRNMRDGFTIGHNDPSRISMTAGRQGYANVKPRYVTFSYSVFDMDEATMDEFIGLFNEVGIHTAFVMSLDPDSRPTHNTIYCQFTDSFNQDQRILRQYNLQSVVFQEKN